MMKTRQDNDVIDHIGMVYVFMILNFHDQSHQMLTLMKTKQDNYVIDCIDAVYVENETQLP